MGTRFERIHRHAPEDIAARLGKGERHSYLRDVVYGGIDGAVTTLAVVSGVVGANLSPNAILILGIANLVADGFSMGAANYLATKSEHDELRFWSEVESEHIEKFPEGEKEEVRQILARQGFAGELLDQAVRIFVSNKTAWLQLMLTEEYGLPRSVRNPIKASMATFGAFVVCGTFPLIPFVFSFDQPFFATSVLTGVVFFTIGSLKSRWSIVSWWRSGAVTLGIGAIASALAYVLGAVIGSFVQG